MSNQIQRNYLEIKSISELIEVKKPIESLHLEKVNSEDFQLNKFLYKEIGKKHSWIDRLIWSDKNWTDYINSSGVFGLCDIKGPNQPFRLLPSSLKYILLTLTPAPAVSNS